MADCQRSRVELGSLVKFDKEWMKESRFFPSKVGGKPAWLDLKNISIDVNCGVCSNPCIFLCQLYAPLDDQENAFHRTIFVFVCTNPNCCETNKCENFKVFRCQLPEVNEFFVPEEPNDDESWHPECTIGKFNDTCEVCGCLGKYRCGKCKLVRYCSKSHQILDWKSGHGQICGTGEKNTNNSNILFPEYDVITSPEYDSEDEDEPIEKTEEQVLKEFEELYKSGRAGTMQDVPVEMFGKLAEAKETDKYLRKFKERLTICPDQVLRYERGGDPLWIAEPKMKVEDVPNCELCGGPRQFEFQILSTMLNYFDLDSLDKSLDWGTLLVFTCKNNCFDGPSYKKEYLWKQDV
ncbi:hypothetical protein RUM44_013700 [Polyplax serrata]|uniref:MYND-type domain-containing protein n=1 Tax=Polyplax serrata TaxID=468196 RepID=A0ABR1BF80_POLSC